MMINPIPGAHIPRDPTRKGSYGFQRTPTHKHQGIDVAAPEGTPVRAVAAGTVARVVNRPGTRGFRGYGKTVVLRHELEGRPVWTLYAHLSQIEPAIVVGVRVLQGKILGRVGRTCDTRTDPDHLCGGAHLHFEASPTPYPQRSESPRLDPGFFLPTRKRRIPL